MSKDKGSKNVKKAPAADHTKTNSDYQAGKKSVSSDSTTGSKKK
ncbi:hypothetical protein HDF19_15480 [Mucilaginibacter sp. E4BP6]|jgi:hypothetical protein|nr:hypothetical protein [Mucilaginibacter sp. E4BP6]NYE65603.1 hypothetical protein [Mucilaginibacter sp. E4BP6]